MTPLDKSDVVLNVFTRPTVSRKFFVMVILCAPHIPPHIPLPYLSRKTN